MKILPESRTKGKKEIDDEEKNIKKIKDNIQTIGVFLKTTAIKIRVKKGEMIFKKLSRKILKLKKTSFREPISYQLQKWDKPSYIIIKFQILKILQREILKVSSHITVAMMKPGRKYMSSNANVKVFLSGNFITSQIITQE